jgi:hypothetical protein
MKKVLWVFIVALSLLACESVRAESRFLSSDTYSLTSNSASRTILVTNFPSAGSASFEWYPSSVLLYNRGATTGALLRVEHLRTGVSNIMETNGTVTVTNQLIYIYSTSAVSTNWAPGERWYVTPSSDQLRITTVVTNGELILNREVAR